MSNTSLRYSISGYIGVLMNLVAPLIIIPILCYRFGNWLLLFGSFFVYIGEKVSSNRKAKYVIFVLVIVGCIYYWISNGFDFRKGPTFYLICFLFGFLCYQLYRAIGFGDELTRAMIAAQGNKNADEEITEEIKKGLENLRK
jgi:hypothetical protein